MDTSQLVQSLQSTVASLKQRGYGGRALVFWYDPQGDFEAAFDTLELGNGVETLRLAHTPFWTKYHLLIEKPETSFVLYAPYAEPAPEENWLLDLQLQGELFSADRAAMVWRQLGLRERGLEHFLRAGEHLSFFNSKQRQSALAAIGVAPESDEMTLRLTMMCALANLKVADAQQLIRALLCAGLSEAENALYQEIMRYFAAAELWQLIAQSLNYQREQPSLRDLFISLSLTHLQQQLTAPLPDALRSKVISPGGKAYVFVDNWLRHVRDGAQWQLLSESVAGDLNIAALAAELEPEHYLKAETFRAFDMALIRQSVAQLLATAPAPSTVSSWLGHRQVLYWAEEFRQHYLALGAACELLAALEQLTDFPRDSGELWQNYASSYYQLDQHYRHYITASDQVGSVLAPLTEQLERVYSHSFVTPLSEAWSDALEVRHQGSGDIPWGLAGTVKQWHFYRQYVEPVLARNDREKVFVIISDALRYEVAKELQALLITELRGEATLTPLQGVLPSITRLGMAALLPGEGLELRGAEVLMEGQATRTTEQRQAALAQSGVSALAIRSDALLALGRDEGRKAVQPQRVIFIYHNLIDAIGDDAASERNVFAACQQTIEQLQQLVRKIANQLNGTNILITSDHGFLYQRQPLATFDKVQQPRGEVRHSGRRHVLGEGLSGELGTQIFTLPYVAPAGLQVAAPRGSLRFALQGAGSLFVHGGASLQETCVPLISYKHQRAIKGDEGPSRKVGVQVSASHRRVTNTTFTVRLVQDAPISGRVRPRQITVHFADASGAPLTNSYPLLLASDAPQATDREFIARLSVGRSSVSREADYYLIITDSEDDLELLRERWQFDLAFTDDFGEF